MHHINKLPSSILSLILDHATAPLNRWWKDWRRGLTLLQVCSLWRTHGSPLVYKYMFIYCIEADSDDDSDDESDDLATRANHTYGMLPKMKWVSNANLTIANENVSIVNKVVINLRGPGYLFPFLNGVLEILTMSQTTWESVTSLSFHLASDFAEPERAGDLTVRDQVEITARFTDLFRSMFSRINDLRINGNDAGEMFCNFADRLTYHYSMCAKRLEFLYPMSCMAPCFSEGLTYLHLVVRPYIGQLIPLVHSLPLKYLCLDGISPNFRWQCFYSQSENGRNVCFRDLETLTVHYNAIVGVDVDAMVTSNYSGRENEELAYTLYFPSLKYLTISKCPENGGLLCNSRIPNILHTVNFEGSVGAVKALADCGITRLHNLTASLRANTISEYDQKQMVTATNYLYSVPQIENTAILCLFDNVTLPDTDELDWRNLDELTLDSPASLTQVLQLIPKMPKLTSLSCYSLQIKQRMLINAPQKITEESWNFMPSLETNIERIAICNHVDLFSRTVAFAIACYFMVSIKSLKYLLVSRLNLAQISEFIDTFKQIYPHLLDIKVNTQ